MTKKWMKSSYKLNKLNSIKKRKIKTYLKNFLKMMDNKIKKLKKMKI